MEIGELFKAIDDGASLNDSDIKKALADGYWDILAPKSAIDFINEKAQVNIQKNKRNGLSRKDHLEVARAIQAVKDKQNGTDFREYSGRHPKYDVVHNWRTENPNGKKADCIRETGLSKPTVYKWWDIAG